MELILGRCEIQETDLHEILIKNLPGGSEMRKIQSFWEVVPSPVGGCLSYPRL